MNSDIPSEAEIEAQLREMVKQGLMEEVSPRKFSLTEKGNAYAETLIKTPKGKKLIDDLDRGFQRGKRKH